MDLMAPLEIPEISRPVRGRHVYVRAPEPIEFPSSEPLEEHVSETKRHLTLRTTLFLLLEEAFASRGAIGSDQFVYWDPRDPKKCLSPDVFVKLGVPNELFDHWKAWERGAPDLAIEIASKSDRPDEAWEVKLARYLASGIREVVRFDPIGPSPSFSVWDRIDGDLVERSPDDPDLFECATLGLWWVLQSTDVGPTLRLAKDREGRHLLPTPAEDRLRLSAELQEERRARTVVEHERLLAEQEKALALEERIRAEQKAREEAEARALAEQRALGEAAARRRSEEERDALAAEVERLRAELARAR
jgi:Uma2 family endonuclease